jgi:hypothetical protein
MFQKKALLDLILSILHCFRFQSKKSISNRYQNKTIGEQFCKWERNDTNMKFNIMKVDAINYDTYFKLHALQVLQ